MESVGESYICNQEIPECSGLNTRKHLDRKIEMLERLRILLVIIPRENASNLREPSKDCLAYLIPKGATAG